MNTAPAPTTTSVTVSQAVISFLSAVLALAVLFGVNLSPEQIAGILLAVSTGSVVAALLWHRWGVAKNKVLEVTKDGTTVVAGQANEIVTPGTKIREIGAEPVMETKKAKAYEEVEKRPYSEDEFNV